MKDVTSFASTIYGTGSRRYSAPARWFHWVTALLIFLMIPLGWIFAEFKTKGNPPTAFEAPFPGSPFDYATVHKTLGLLILAIVVVRVVYRLANPPPPLPGRMGTVTRALSHASHWLLYLVMLVMPVSGYLAASGGKHPISILGLFDFPKLPVGKEIGETAEAFHDYTQWALYALIALHLAGAAWHLFIRRDAILDRMLPSQANAE